MSREKTDRPLVILSLPFIRLGRVLLGEPVLAALRESHDVLIVSPNAAESSFQAEFAASNIKFLVWNAPSNMNRWDGYLGVIANIQRVNGYWLRHRNKGLGMAYFHQNAIYQYQKDALPRKLPLIKIILHRLIALTGFFSFSWRLTDLLRGFLFRDTTELDAAVAKCPKVTLIQASNWGEQDTYLSWYASKKNIPTIFIPYTTDQLYCNGFMLSHHAVVCVQGEFEEKCSSFLQGLPEKRIRKLGSAWFRNLDVLSKEQGNIGKNVKTTEVKYILFSGHSREYFSREAEYQALTTLEQAVTQGVLGKAKIIYRPVVTTPEEIQIIHKDWSHYENIEIQLPQVSIVGLSQGVKQHLKTEWQNYIRDIAKADVLVMGFISSLAIDLGYLGKPSIIYVEDAARNPIQARMDLQYEDGKIPCLEAFPVVRDVSELVPLVRKMLYHPERYQHQNKYVKSAWDSPDVNFSEMLHALLNR